MTHVWPMVAHALQKAPTHLNTRPLIISMVYSARTTSILYELIKIELRRKAKSFHGI